MSGNLLSRIRLASTQAKPEPFIFADTRWLGGKHDGYPLVSFREYLAIRPRPPRDDPNRAQVEAGRLQALLVFGLLEAILEEKIPESELLRVQEGGEGQPHRVLSSRNIPSYLRRWRRHVQSLGTGAEARQKAMRTQATLKQAQGILMMEALRPRNSVFQAAGLHERDLALIFLQIGALAEEIVSSSYVFATSIPRQPFSWTFLQARLKVLHEDMLSQGWCAFTIPMLFDNITILGYARVTEPVIRESSIGHGDCTREGCVINNIDTACYQPQHKDKDCKCQFLHADGIADIISTGKIPVVQRQSPDYTQMKVADSSTTKYVAISHVWADGLGSTAEKGLPSCQIERLAILAERLEADGAFWADSLCVPAKEDLRKEAIRLMADTYKNATAVLVLDSSIRLVPLTASREKKLLRVVTSGWMQRLWTLQEAALANKLVFEFADGLASLEELIPAGEDLFNGVAPHLASEVFRLKKHRQVQLTLSDVGQGLRWRTTSKPRDETLAIAGLLNVDALELASLPADERMARFLHRLTHLPSGIIFLSGPKLKQEGFHWAPRTLMRARDSGVPFAAYDAVCTASGLMSQYAALHIPRTTIDRQNVWIVQDISEQQIYKITDVYLGENAAGLGYPTTYECDLILVPKRIAPSETSACVTVLRLDTGQQDRVTCRFQKRLFIQRISNTELAHERNCLCLEATSEHLKVKVV